MLSMNKSTHLLPSDVLQYCVQRWNTISAFCTVCDTHTYTQSINQSVNQNCLSSRATSSLIVQ